MMGILELGARAVEDFRGDVDALTDVMRASWAQGPIPPYLYTPELMASWLAQPGLTPALCPAIYAEDRLVAFALGCPRRAVVGGAPRGLVISAFLTVGPEAKHAGYGILVWGALIHRAREAGFEGVVNYCEAGGPMLAMIDGASRMLGLPLVRAKTFDHLVRLIEPRPAAAPHPPGSTGNAAAAHLLAAAEGLAGRAELRRTWTSAEARWALARPGAVAVHDADRAAILTGTVTTVADAAQTRCLVIDDVLWDGLEPGARPTLLERMLSEAAALGARFASVPALGYADLTPMHRAGFAPAGHIAHAYLSLWGAPSAAGACEGFYLDVV